MNSSCTKKIDIALQGGGSHGAFTGAFWTACSTTGASRSKGSAGPAPEP